jgi:hypothetical protein
MNIKLQKICCNEDLIDKIISQINYELQTDSSSNTFLLNINKNNFNIIEKFVYDFTIKELNNRNKILDDNIFIEFWFKNKFSTNTLHVDCDEFQKFEKLKYLYPIISSVSYFNNSDIPTLITNIDMDRYKYKDYEDDISLFLSFPEKYKQIIFEPNYFHGTILLDDNSYNQHRFVILVNIWDKKPTNVSYYNICKNINYTKESIIFNYENLSDYLIDVPFTNKEINSEFMEKLLYYKDEKLFFDLKDTIIKYVNNDKFSLFKLFVDKITEYNMLNSKLKNTFGDIITDINEILENENLKYNRFLQRFINKKFFSKEVCEWLINEAEKYSNLNSGWDTKRHDNYPTTDLPVEKISSIFGFVLSSFSGINNFIKKSYNIDENIKLDINDLFIVKYKYDEQNYLDLHTDGSFITFNLLLSNENDFEGGGTYFDDGLNLFLEQGDLLIHSGKIRHCGLPIKKGLRYLLVGFINIKLII